MPSKQTQNYQLSQWEKTDKVLMDDFNEDNRKIDAAIKAEADVRAAENTKINAALAAKADSDKMDAALALKQDATAAVRVKAGTYSGDGKASRWISAGFVPKAVLVMRSNSLFIAEGTGSTYGGLAVTGGPAATGGATVVEINSSGFYVYQNEKSHVYANCTGLDYRYLAVG